MNINYFIRYLITILITIIARDRVNYPYTRDHMGDLMIDTQPKTLLNTRVCRESKVNKFNLI